MWSAKLIKQEYGYGKITVMNSTALSIRQGGDQNHTSSGDIHDDVWIRQVEITGVKQNQNF
jgi:hypothetical protein